ncbi:hypothetical protein QTJ16_004244 [Diplocarpon rosae]|uniref:Uncharacterized protein n=1 Tax=Diplocarpon rosae TaxID=946125 RepID=A0AAD9WC23_9HELO|nr:hypothetical protein QTJ16_004244 [Diplocarpon rosae]
MLYSQLTAHLALLAALPISIIASPLNINMGAYSPGLIVGDGEISLGSGEAVEAVLSTLAGASSGGAASAKAGEAPATEAASSESASETRKRNKRQSDTEADLELELDLEAEDEDVDDTEAPVSERDLAGFNAALAYAAVALKTSPGVELGTGEGGSGVGIIVRPGVDAGAEAAAPAAEKY